MTEPAPPAPTIPALLRDVARRHPDRDALVDADRRLSYRDFDAQALQVTRAAMAHGVAHGDRVALWAPNSATFLVALAGLMGAGAAVVPINTRFKAGEASDALLRTGARLVLTVGAFLDRDLVAALRSVDALAELPIVTLDDSHADDPHVTGWTAFLAGAAAVTVDDARARAASVTSADIAYVILTSGTTGHPKGVQLSHAANLMCAQELITSFALHDGERVFVVLPFFHIFGLNFGFVTTLRLGGASVISSVFDPAEIMRLIEAERITALPGPPTIHAALLDSPDRAAHDLSSLRLAFVAATAVPAELVRRIVGEGLARDVVSGYGLTEAGGTVALTPAGASVDDVAQWAGTVLPSVELKVVDDAGQEVPNGEPGEFLVRSALLMDGYAGDPEATAEAIDADGWLHTGDVGIRDDQDRIRVTDRKKDMFIVGGFNAYPAEIERILVAHEGIAQVAVVGMPDERMGEVGAAFVIARDPALTAAQVFDYAREVMANYKVPRHVEIVDELPMTLSFKVSKQPLRERAREAARELAAAARPRA